VGVDPVRTCKHIAYSGAERRAGRAKA
jgi:hypothetical protein